MSLPSPILSGGRSIGHLTKPGWAIVLAVGALYGTGLATIFATERQAESPTFTIKQVVFLLAGLVAVGVIVRVGFQRIYRLAYLWFALALLALVPPAVARVTGFDFFGMVPNIRGAYRWIMLPGFQLQPSEPMKVAFILALAWYLRYRTNYRTLKGLFLPIAGTLAPLGLILLEPDLGTGMLMAPVLLGMLTLAGARAKHLALLVVVAVAITPLLWFKMESYQRMRVTAVLMQSNSLRDKMESDPDRYGYLMNDAAALRREAREWAYSSGMQLVRSKAALGSGGVVGQGWGHGTYVEYNFLPDRHNDFVFALIGHQWGLLGCLGVLMCYAVIVIAGAVIATHTAEPVGRLLAGGLVVLLASQVFINVGMCVGLLPVTGMTLPFVSSGGSSVLTSFIAVGLLISVSRHRPFLLAPEPFEFRRMPLSFPPRPDAAVANATGA